MTLSNQTSRYKLKCIRIVVCLQATGLKVWALDHIRDIALDCVNEVQALVDANNTNNEASVTTAEVNAILANTCVDTCVHGSCSNGMFIFFY